MSLTITPHVSSQVEDSVNLLCPSVVLFVLNTNMHICKVCHDAINPLLNIYIWGKKGRIEVPDTHGHGHRHTKTKLLYLKVQRVHYLLFSSLS